MKKSFLLCLLLFTKTCLPAQQKEFVFKNFTQEEGLPSNEAYFVFEDSKHYVWIATDLGVTRYYGNKFQQFDLPDNVVFKILEDNKGRIWFFSHKAQLAYFENEQMHYYKYNHHILGRISKIHIINASVGNDETIYLSSSLDTNYVITPDGSIKSIPISHSKKTCSYYQINPANGNSLFCQCTERFLFNSDSIEVTVKNNNSISTYIFPSKSLPSAQHAAIKSSDGSIYFFTGKMLAKLNKDGTCIWKEMPFKILCLKMSGGNIWVGGYKYGALLLSANLSSIIRDVVLPQKSVTCITMDYEGGLWFTTLENGVYYVKNINIDHITDEDKNNQFVSKILNIEDSFFIYSKSTGIFKYVNGKGNLFLPLTNVETSSLMADETKTLYYFGSIDSTGTIKKINDSYFKYLYLINTNAEPCRIKDSFFISFTSLLASFKSYYLENGYTGTLREKNFPDLKKNIVLNKACKAIFADAGHHVWAGANDGLYRSGFDNKSFDKFKPLSPVLNKGVYCIRQMQNGYMVIGIRGGGIAIIADTGIVATITENEGLLSNKIRYLLPIGKQLWAATAKGISVVQFSSFYPLKYSINNIGKDDGFYNITINQLIQFQKSIVAATSNGIYFINNADAILNFHEKPLPFYINTVSFYSGDTAGISSVVLPYSKNRLVIKYNAISYNAYEKVIYYYRFGRGTDTAWHTTTNTELLLENLEPGLYNLQLKASIPNQERQSLTQSLIINIEKPWWQNNWLRLFALLLFFTGTYFLVSKKIKKIKEEEKRKTDLKAKLSELEQTALRSQMNPHFIFNCLTSIQQLIISGNKTDASEYLVKFSRLIRKTLDMSSRPYITVSEEKEYLNEYLLLEQLRLSGQFEFSIITDSTIDVNHTFIPNMMVQPVVENCIRHGIKSLENRKGIITVNFHKEKDSVICTVTDNGTGFKSISYVSESAFTKHKSYGMDIIRKRLETFSEFNTGKSGIEIKSLYNDNGDAAGTTVILCLPYKNSL